MATMSESPSTTDSSSTGNKICRVVIQQCLEADLRFDTPDAPVSIGQGMIVFVCFLQGSSSDRIDSIVKSILNVKLSEPQQPASLSCDTNGVAGDPKRKSVLECDYDILIIPQATLGGRLKGTTAQYHGLVSKDLGYELFQKFVEAIKSFKSKTPRKGKVESGVYGARQILKMNTNGPFTHVFEF